MAQYTFLPGIVQQFDLPTDEQLANAVAAGPITGITAAEAEELIRTYPGVATLFQHYGRLYQDIVNLEHRGDVAIDAYERHTTT